MVDTVVLEKGLEKQEFFRHEIYPRPTSAVGVDIQVSDSEVVLRFRQELEPNCRYVVVVTPEVKARDGSAVSDLWVSYFTSKYSPAYATVREVVSELSFASGVFTPNLVLQRIRDASLLADHLTNNEEERKEVPYTVRQFVRYKAAHDLLWQLVAGRLLEAESYALGDMRVDKRPPDLDELLGRLAEQVEYWKREMLGTSAYPAPRWVVKSYSYNPQPVTPRTF